MGAEEYLQRVSLGCGSDGPEFVSPVPVLVSGGSGGSGSHQRPLFRAGDSVAHGKIRALPRRRYPSFISISRPLPAKIPLDLKSPNCTRQVPRQTILVLPHRREGFKPNTRQTMLWFREVTVAAFRHIVAGRWRMFFLILRELHSLRRSRFRSAKTDYGERRRLLCSLGMSAPAGR